ncbi:MAG TPA: hypothetical protein VFA39_08485 [Steroidobacteraceae bacterium]|nr:hypothetical protein [Steroidobacteraceae bacterium]
MSPISGPPQLAVNGVDADTRTSGGPGAGNCGGGGAPVLDGEAPPPEPPHALKAVDASNRIATRERTPPMKHPAACGYSCTAP